MKNDNASSLRQGFGGQGIKKELDMNNNLKTLRHSTAHLLAHALTELFPKTKLTIGPATEEGFFYDFLPEANLKEDDLPVIAARMSTLAEKNYPLTHRQISKQEARAIYKDNPFKLELIDGIPGDTVGLAEQGDFYDLCRGDHVASTGLLKHFKLIGISGSYWRADRNNKALQRISGTAFFTEKDLADFERKREEAAKYDHRKLGKQMDLFSFHDEGVGFPFFHPKGKTIINILIKYLRTLLDEAEYQEISTPVMMSDELWRQSGHYAHYKDNMYFCNIDESGSPSIDGVKKQYAIRPMNCPGSILVYKERPHSYRELPMRLSEFGLVHRHELSGVLHGLLRVRSFTQDDAHVYCTVEQIEQEVLKIINMTYTVYKKFNFEKITVGVSTKPEKSMGSQEWWDKATQALKNALDAAGLAYEIYEGEGAFYGPKIEFGIEDSIGRKWQCGTVQVDPFLPENFDLCYVASTGTKERPVMIHRAIYGSMERFFAILLEHYKGLFPFWLAPIQVRVLTITDEQKEYAYGIVDALKKVGIRTEIDTSSDPISGQIKTAQLAKIPWMIVIGKKEVEQHTVTIRYFDGKQEFGVTRDALIEKVQEANK